MGGGAQLEATGRARATAALWTAGMLAVFSAVEVARGVPHAWAVLGARLLWIGALVLAAVALRRGGRGRSVTLLLAGAVLLGVLALAVICGLLGGVHFVGFGYLLCAPLFVTIFLPGRRDLVALAGAVGITACVALAVRGGEDPFDVFGVALRAAVAAVLAYVGAVLHSRVRRQELEAERARAHALDALARSEASRARLEPLARAGTQVRAVAHHMSSPVAAVKCNVQFLRDVLAGGAPADPAELREVLDETAAAVERLAAELAELRRTAPVAQEGAHPPTRRAGE